MKKCQYPLALSELKKALEAKPKDPLLHHSIALLYFQFKKYGETVKYFKTALALRPKFTDARVYLGRSLIETGKLKEALKELNKAKEDLTYPHSENIHAHTGLVYYKQKKYALAEKHFSVARTIKKNDCFLALYHAKSFYFQNQLKKALAILEPAKKWCKTHLPICFPPSYDAYFFSALAYDKLGLKKKVFFNLKTFLGQVKESPYLPEAEKLMNNLRAIPSSSGKLKEPSILKKSPLNRGKNKEQKNIEEKNQAK